MSTRRTTRAASRAASSRAPSSVGASELDPPRTPSSVGRSRRSAPTSPLPSVGLRTSTAYGTNSTFQPGYVSGPDHHDQINNVLSSILEPVREEEESPASSAGPVHTGMFASGPAPTPRGKPRRRGAAAAAAAAAPASPEKPEVPAPVNASFNLESGIFGVANPNSSALTDSSLLGGKQKAPAAKQPAKAPSLESVERQIQKPIIAAIAKNTRVESPAKGAPIAAAPPRRHLSHFLSDVGELLWDILSYVASLLSLLRGVVLSTRGKYTTIALVIGIALTGLLSQTSPQIPSNPIRWYGGFDISHNVGQFIPYTVSHPFSIFKDDSWKEFEKRLTAAEYDIAHLKTHMTLDSKAISHLESLLPDTIVCPRDANGNLQIPDHFWHALKEKLRSDRLVEVQPEPEPTTNLSKKQIIGIAEKVFDKSNTKNWDKFLGANRAKVMSWYDESFKKEVDVVKKEVDTVKKDALASKSDFMKLIEQSWADTKDAILTELSPHIEDLGLIRSRVSLMQKTEEMTKGEIRDIAIDVAKKLISSAQLGSLADAKMRDMTADSNDRINHFSQGTGAAINARLTTSPYVFPHMKISRLHSWLLARPVPIPNPPTSAISKWDEHGDCWCSELNSTAGVWPTLGVILGNKIYPDRVVIEHIPTTASLEPGSAPKDMELWAFIPDRRSREAIERDSQDFFDSAPDPLGLVQIGAWTYDTETMSNVQAFPLQVKMGRGARVSTNNLQVRVKSNWGGERINYACLYRVRVNGEIADEDVDDRWNRYASA